MPYKKNSDLPESVRKVLPQKAQTLFRKVFNSAYDEYKNEATVFRVAWSAVKKQYTKVGDKWVEK
jgi:cation transport regulator